MIVGIQGIIEKKEPTCLHINAGGLIYEVFISLNCRSNITTDSIKLLATQIIREDTNTLYGFLDANEKNIFDRLLKISGIGPKVAMAVLSTFTPEVFGKILTTNDLTMLKKVPGLGPKNASRLLVELGGFVVADIHDTRGALYAEATMALESLGFKKEAIAKALTGISATDTSTLVKEALKSLQR